MHPTSSYSKYREEVLKKIPEDVQKSSVNSQISQAISYVKDMKKIENERL